MFPICGLSLPQVSMPIPSVEWWFCAWALWVCILACVFQALVGEKACYQSVSSYAGQIVYLGTKVLAYTWKISFFSLQNLLMFRCNCRCHAHVLLPSTFAVCSHHDSEDLEGGTSADVLTAHTWSRVNPWRWSWVTECPLRTWRLLLLSPFLEQRLDCLMKLERFPEALSLAWSFHEGTAKAVLGGCHAWFRHLFGRVGSNTVWDCRWRRFCMEMSGFSCCCLHRSWDCFKSQHNTTLVCFTHIWGLWEVNNIICFHTWN